MHDLGVHAFTLGKGGQKRVVPKQEVEHRRQKLRIVRALAQILWMNSGQG